ncbi:hypothetical protein FQR65_LT20164 [Abscondita terminalis]|nr:hypothetical protein FQR65_LT20164 [Abscondita terminalis]
MPGLYSYAKPVSGYLAAAIRIKGPGWRLGSNCCSVNVAKYQKPIILVSEIRGGEFACWSWAVRPRPYNWAHNLERVQAVCTATGATDVTRSPSSGWSYIIHGDLATASCLGLWIDRDIETRRAQGEYGWACIDIRAGVLKIDGSYIRPLTRKPTSSCSSKPFQAFAAPVSLPLIAERVETARRARVNSRDRNFRLISTTSLGTSPGFRGGQLAGFGGFGVSAASTRISWPCAIALPHKNMRSTLCFERKYAMYWRDRHGFNEPANRVVAGSYISAVIVESILDGWVATCDQRVDRTKVSGTPEPPIRISLPVPPIRGSLPVPPDRMSSPLATVQVCRYPPWPNKMSVTCTANKVSVAIAGAEISNPCSAR